MLLKQPLQFMMRLLVLGLFVFVNACRGLQSQSAKDLFLSGRLPKSLERLANQDYQLRAKESEIVARVQKDALNPNLLTVAVIDNGIDLAHPDLIHQLAFDVREGRVVGAGYDFMGEDAWGSSNLINANIFAFGAKSIEKGLIAGPLENPIQTLREMNEEFWKSLDGEFAAQPQLQKSLFSKLNRSNFSLIGAFSLVNYQSLSLKAYEKNKKEKKLINFQSKEKMLKDSRFGGQKEVAQYIENAWTLNPDRGLPAEVASAVLPSLEHADLFWQAIEKSLDKMPESHSFKRAFNSYVEFMAQRSRSFDRGHDATMMNLLQSLSSALSFSNTSRSSIDPLSALKVSLRDLSRTEGVFSEFSKNSLFQSGRSESEALQSTINRFESIVQFKEKQASLAPDEEKYIAASKKMIGALREASRWVVDERSLDQSGKREDLASAYRRYAIRASHPFLSGQSATSTHGSHVGGKIAIAHPDIRILPVRVTTQTVDIAPATLELMRANFTKDFQLWIMEPLVYKAVGETLGSVYPDLDFSPKSRAETARLLMKRLQAPIQRSFYSKGLEYKFLGEVKAALAFVGERKVKLANISLGINFEKAPTSVRSENQEFALERAFDFLRYEYFKYRIAETIEKKAPHTLFVIASGNDGKWIDGQSRSALPVDISSPWLEEYQEDLKIEAPNNRMKNVLGVGSIDPKHRLSSFSNIPINVRTPFVLAEGESVLSAIKTTDLEAVEQMMKKKFPEIENILRLDLSSGELSGWMEENFRGLEGLSVEERKELQDHLSLGIMKDAAAIGEMLQVLKLHLFMKFPEHRARLTGTSMATPTVVGILSEKVIEKAKKLGVPVKELYDHPEFTPARLVEDVFARAEPLSRRSVGISLAKLVGDKKQAEGPSIQKMDLQIEKFFSLGPQGTLLQVGDYQSMSCRRLFSVDFAL
ncbi:MAG: hypothetical protein RJB66_2638 [Pseudomonadota bacterium]